MKPIIVNIIGYTAAFAGTILMLPQVYKTYLTRHVDDLSLVMLVIYLVNCCLWGVYGYFLHSVPMLICNGIALLIGMILIIMKFRFSKKS